MDLIVLDWTRMGKVYCLAGVIDQGGQYRVVRPLHVRGKTEAERNTGWSPYLFDGYSRWQAFKMIDPGRIYYAIWIAVVLSALLTMNLLDSRTGRAIRALRRGHVAAEAFGVHTPRTKLLVFIYAAVLAGLSGWLYAHFQRAVNPTPFGAEAGIEYLFVAVVGGAGAFVMIAEDFSSFGRAMARKLIAEIALGRTPRRAAMK